MSGVCENSFLSEENSISEKTSASWIKDNMIESTSESPAKRALAEIQLRVQRATQKLNIPDWYLNKKSKAPKILTYSNSTEYREPSWRRGVKPEKMSTNIPKNTYDPTGIYKVSTGQKTSMNQSLPSGPNGTPRILEKSTNENNSSPTVHKIPEVDKSGMKNPEPIEIVKSGATGPKVNETFVNFPRPSSFFRNKSGTFPKISPSRKLKNINIVFPPTKTPPKPDLPKSSPPPLPLETNFDTDWNSNSISEVNKSNLISEVNKSNLISEGNKSNLISEVNKYGQIENSFENILSGDEKFNTPRKIKMNKTFTFNSSFANVVSPKPFSKKVDTSITSPAFDFNIPANSTSMETETTVYMSALDKLTPARTSAFRENTEHVSNFSRDSVTTSKSLLNRNFLKKGSEKKHSTYWLGEVKPFGPDSPKTCRECGAKAPRIFAAVTTSSLKNANQVIKEKLFPQKFEKTQGAKTSQTTSPVSVTNIENVDKEKEIQYGDNLVQEIIQELKEKTKLKNSSALLGTKYFVNRLVNDLGGETLPEVSSDEEVDSQISDSDQELNSEDSLSSISMSFKMSEPESHCGIVTSTLKSNVKKNKKPVNTYSAPSEDKGVVWIPVKMPDLPRTSTLMSSKPKRSGSKIDSPCISPIPPLSNNRADEKIYKKFYGIIESKPKVTTKKFLNTDKGGVLDSGYSDRSSLNANKSARSTNYSISDESWDSNRAVKDAACITVRPNTRSRDFMGKRNGIYVV